MERELAASLARRLGLAFDEPVILGEGMNVLVHLQPSPIVARVTRLLHLVRPLTALAGGTGLAKHLGARAVAPSDLIDSGPHAVGGRYVTFWTYRTASEAAPSLLCKRRLAGPSSGRRRVGHIRERGWVISVNEIGGGGSYP